MAFKVNNTGTKRLTFKNSTYPSGTDVKVVKYKAGSGTSVKWSKPITLYIYTCTGAKISTSSSAGTNSEPNPSLATGGARSNFSDSTSGSRQCYYGDELTITHSNGGSSSYYYDFSYAKMQPYCYRTGTGVGSEVNITSGSSFTLNNTKFAITNNAEGDHLYLKVYYTMTEKKGKVTTTQSGSSEYSANRKGSSTSSTYTSNTYPTSPQTFTSASTIYAYITLPYGATPYGGDNVAQVVISGQNYHIGRRPQTLQKSNAGNLTVYAYTYHITSRINSGSFSNAAQYATTNLCSASYVEALYGESFGDIYVSITDIRCRGSIVGSGYINLPAMGATKTFTQSGYSVTLTINTDGNYILLSTNQTSGNTMTFNWSVSAMTM